MPVWHEFTKTFREEGLLEVVGIATEQHPRRTRLFAQWKGIEWPIVWDPFNLTGSKAVPNVIAVDEFGIVRSIRPRRDTFEDEFLFAEFSDSSDDPPEAREASAVLLEVERHPESSFEHVHYQALSDLLWGDGSQLDEALEILEAQVEERPDDPSLAFRAGVARRMRFDSAHARPDDFQTAVDHWGRALATDPSQYIWRRRIQQYGPRMDKPYNFYSWIETAQKEIAGRGEMPLAIRVALTPAELAEKSSFAEGGAASEPDAAGAIPRDGEKLIGVESAVAFDTSSGRSVASVNLVLRPNDAKQAHWNHETGALQVWVTAPDGWQVSEALLEDPPRADVPVSDELRNLSFEVRLPDGAGEGTLDAYALYYVCAGADGTCLYLRQDFEVPVRRP